MKSKVEFIESQNFRRLWLIILLAIINGLFIYGCIVQIAFGKPWGNNPMPDEALIILSLSFLLLSAFFLFFQLDTVIDKDGVYFRLFPIHLKFKFFQWNEISEFEVAKINNFAKFGGWGLRTKGFNFRNINFGSYAYTVYGNKVLKLILKNNRKIYIGTQKYQELSEFLRKLNSV